eukprot:SAG22_NODE_423_length_10665_cov_7.110543_6_plen_590_part_00
MPMTKEQKAIYVQINKANETILRPPGSIAGQPFVGDGLTDCKVLILDHCAQVQLDDLTRCTVTVGPCEDSIFIRNAVDCEVHAIGRQIRTRDCVNCKFYLHVPTDPVIENVHGCEIGEFHSQWPGLDDQFVAAGLDRGAENKWDKIYDFTPGEIWDDDHPGTFPEPHWTAAAPVQTPRVLSSSGELLSGGGKAPAAAVAAAAAADDGGGDGGDAGGDSAAVEVEAAAESTAAVAEEEAAGSDAAQAGGAPGAPVCLVVQEGEELRLHEDGLALLNGLGAAPVAVIAVAGLYRTGKSFLLNQLATAGVAAGGGASAAGFTVGHDTESCTRGIWIQAVPAAVWPGAGSSEEAAGAAAPRLLLMDSEGLASVDQDESYDVKVFSLAILLSSLFIYNSMGTIDETAIDRLFLVGELTKNIVGDSGNGDGGNGDGGGDDGGGGGSSGTSSAAAAAAATAVAAEADRPPVSAATAMEAVEALSRQFPPFVWLLRDFTLNLAKAGQPITANEYLEGALEEKAVPAKPGRAASRVEENNAIRRSFRQLFSDRQCRALVRPVVDEAHVRACVCACVRNTACPGTPGTMIGNFGAEAAP